MFNDKKKTLSSSKIDSMPISTVFGVDVVVTGDMQGETVIRIDGKVKGNVSFKQGIVLGEKAQIEGNVNSDCIVIYGCVTGNITCKELIVRKSGIINGDIQTEAVEIAMGGKYNGKLAMTEPAAKQK